MFWVARAEPRQILAKLPHLPVQNCPVRLRFLQYTHVYYILQCVDLVSVRFTLSTSWTAPSGLTLVAPRLVDSEASSQSNMTNRVANEM